MSVWFSTSYGRGWTFFLSGHLHKFLTKAKRASTFLLVEKLQLRSAQPPTDPSNQFRSQILGQPGVCFSSAPQRSDHLPWTMLSNTLYNRFPLIFLTEN